MLANHAPIPESQAQQSRPSQAGEWLDPNSFEARYQIMSDELDRLLEHQAAVMAKLGLTFE